MQNSVQPKLRAAWIFLCVSALLVYPTIQFRDDTLLSPDIVGVWLEIFMFLLSLPFGLLFIIPGPQGYDIADRFVMWVLALALNYFVWFHLILNLLGRRAARLTTLNLSAGGGVAFAPTPRAEGSPVPRQVRDFEPPPVPEFDDRGQTPLERILRADEPEDC